MGESQFLQVTASILSTLQNSQRFSQSHAHPQTSSSTPLFDTRTVGYPLARQPTDFSTHVTSMGLPPALTGEIATLLSRDSDDYQRFIQQAQSRLLNELSFTTVCPTPEQVPTLVDAACTSFYNRVLASRFAKIEEQARDYELPDGSLVESDETGSDQDSASESDEDDPDPEGEDVDDPEEDENAPIKPGEEVPPLETKYLPIFEALHERGKVLTKPEKTYLVNMTGMTYRQITIWFQNRRRGELKENQNRASVSRASSVYSDSSSDLSENGLNAQLSRQPNTTFNIRSWQLASAIATKGGETSSFPPSPTKFTFGPTEIGPDIDSGSELSETDEESVDVPPGLKVPSLTSMTTVDSASERGPATATSTSSIEQPNAHGSGSDENTSKGWSFRPVKGLPASRHSPPPVLSQNSITSALPTFNFNFAGATSAPVTVPIRSASVAGPAQPTQSITSNERGLTVEMNSTPSNSANFQSLRTSTPPTSTNRVGNALPSSPHSTGSSPDAPSPPPGRGTTSPRPAIKPLPRRTGCAPRPRPPPRSVNTTATATSSNPPSTRASIVLPPTSNPSLANTTLGALLRPNPPGPIIPSEMEERLSAMAGRMGVNPGVGTARPAANRAVVTPTAFFQGHHAPTLIGSPDVNSAMDTTASAVSPKSS